MSIARVAEMAMPLWLTVKEEIAASISLNYLFKSILENHTQLVYHAVTIVVDAVAD